MPARIRRNRKQLAAWRRQVVTAQRRGAFTLLEVMIAMSLSVMLITGVYAAIDLHFKYQQAGRAQMWGSQLMRGIVSYGNHDFNSVIMHVPVNTGAAPAAEEAAAEEETATETTTETEAIPVTIAESTDTLAFGLSGTSTVLHLTVSIPSLSISTTGLYDGQVTGRLSDLAIVSYGICPVNQTNVIRSRDDISVNRPTQGMARRQVDLYNIVAATDDIGPEAMFSPEVTELTFEYFDGSAWQAGWDSRTSNTLPTAVKFKLGIWNPPPRSRNASAGGTGTVTYVEHVFHIPAAIPVTVTNAATAVAPTTP